MKLYIAVLVSLSIAFTSLSNAQDLTIEDIIKKHGEAIGGIDKWENLKSYSIVMQNERETGTFEITSSMLRPNLYRIDYLNPTDILIKSYDGNDGWLARNGVISDMSDGEENEMAEEGEFFEELALSLIKNYEVTYHGIENMDRESFHKISVTKHGTDEQIYFLDTDTFLIKYVSEYSDDQAFKGTYFRTKLFNYEEHDGLMIPMEMELYANDELMRTYKTISVNLNPEFNNGHFSRPNPWLNDRFSAKLAEFDFWVGEWNVFDANTDKLLGRSKIEKVAGGFGVQERFYGIPGPFHGGSLNKYNFFKGQWEQFWIDNSGMTHFFAGKFSEENGMEMVKTEYQGENKVYHTLVFKSLDSGSVRQTWSQSSDSTSWNIVFDGIYRKK